MNPITVRKMQFALAGCVGCDGDPHVIHDDGLVTTTGGSTTGDAGPPDAGPVLEKADVNPPAGWHLWPYPPEDCALFVPDDLSTVEPPVWQPCPFMPDGCTEAGAPWADELGWGYGSLLSVGLDGRSTYLALSRRVEKEDWWELFLLRDNQVIGAWRYSSAWETGSRCTPLGPRLHGPGRAALHVERHQAENSPWVFIGPPDTLMQDPDRTEIFGPPDAALIPDGLVLLSDRRLTFETLNGRFAVRNLPTGETYRPLPYGLPNNEMVGNVPVNDRIFYEAWTGIRSSIWVDTDQLEAPLLMSDSDSYNQFVTDGADAAWQRGVGYVSTNVFQTMELWTSPLATTAAGLAPKLLATLPHNVLDGSATAVAGLSIGDGWIAAWLGLQDVRLYRISDGLERRLPVSENLVWSGTSMYDGMVIAGGALWMKTSISPQPGNKIRFIHRFEIDKLPTVE